MERRILSIAASSHLHEGTSQKASESQRVGLPQAIYRLPDFLGKYHSPAPAQGLCGITGDSADSKVGGRQARRKLLLPNFVSFN